jgi:dihydrofolate reductase
MRKLKLQVQMSLDGYIAGPNDEMDWMTFNWDNQLKEYVNQLTEPVDCIVLGRKLAEGFIPHWAGVAANPDDPEVASGKKFTDTPKVVFTKTLDQSKWDNTELATGDLGDEVIRLKKQEGNDIIVYGGADLVSSLIKEGLIDEYHLFINPVAIGQGKSIFGILGEKRNLTLVHATSFDSGITVLCYTPKNE